MAKLKTNRAANKRYGLTATGKVKRTKANRRHLLANKTSRQRKTGKVLDAYADKSCKKQLKNYYHMVDNQLEKKQNKEGEKNGKSKNS